MLKQINVFYLTLGFKVDQVGINGCENLLLRGRIKPGDFRRQGDAVDPRTVAKSSFAPPPLPPQYVDCVRDTGH